MDYKIGDKVVYPNHGVGVVEQINYGVLNGRTERYYMIRIVSSGLRVMVPQSNAGTVGLRSVIRSNESMKVLGFLEKGKLNSHPDWKHRFKENSERMRTGSLIEVAAVLKSLVSLSRNKPLSFREKKMRARKVPARQRNGYRQEHHRRKRRGDGHQVPRQGQAAVSRDHRKVRIARLLQTCFYQRPDPVGALSFFDAGGTLGEKGAYHKRGEEP